MMIEGYPQKATLRDGGEAIVRPIAPDDAGAILLFFRSLPEEDRQYLRDDVTKPEWLDRYMAETDCHSLIRLVAEVDGQLKGVSTLYRPTYGWTKHVAELRVCVSRELQRKGLGAALMVVMVREAIAMGLEKIVAHVVDNQIGAIRSLEKAGFRREAVLRGQVKDIFGFKRDLVVMANDVSYLWEAMETLVSDYVPALGG